MRFVTCLMTKTVRCKWNNCSALRHLWPVTPFLRYLGIIPKVEPGHVLPRRVLDGKAGGMLDCAPRPREAADHFLGLPRVLDEPKYQLRGFLAGENPVDLFRRYRRSQFRAEFVNLAKGQTASEIPSHSVRVRLEHGRRFHDDDADGWLDSPQTNKK
jgi:hypothetical protein